MRISHPWEQVPPGIAALLRPSIPQTRDAVIEGIRAEVPAYARPLEGAFGAGVRIGVEQALDEFLALVENPALDRSQGREVYVALGRGEAREGRTLEALLAAYRIGARIAWRQISEEARREGIDADSLALLAESIFAYIDELSSYSAEGFAQEQALAAAESDRLRHRLVHLMIDARPPSPRLSRRPRVRPAGRCQRPWRCWSGASSGDASLHGFPTARSPRPWTS